MRVPSYLSIAGPVLLAVPGDNEAEVFGTVIRCGRLAVGQPLDVTPAAGHREHR